MHKPTISVVVPTYNRKSYLNDCISSILVQDHKEWELIVVDDNSTDGTRELVQLKSKQDKRIIYLRKSERTGAPSARNIGLRKASGAYVIFLDSDDVLAPNCLSQRISHMSFHESLDFAVFPQLLFRKIPGDLSRLLNTESQEDDLSRFLTLGQHVDIPWVNGGPIWKKSSLIAFGLSWDEGIVAFQDIQFHTDAIISGMRYEYVNDATPDYCWRMHDGERLGGQLRTRNALISHEKLLFDMWDKMRGAGLTNKHYQIRLFKCIYFLCLVLPRKNLSTFGRSRLIYKLRVRGLLENREFINLYTKEVLTSVFYFSDTLRYRLEKFLVERAIHLYQREGRGGCGHHPMP